MFGNDANFEGHTFADVLGNGTLDHTSWMSNVGQAINSIATIYAALPPYNVSAAATGATNRDGLRAAIAAAVSAGGARIVLPAGTLNFDHSGTNAWVFNLPSNLTIEGQGTALTKLVYTAVGDVGSLAVFATAAGVATSNIRFAHLTIDGDRSGRSADEHKCGVRLGSGAYATNIVFDDVVIQHVPGDAVQVINAAGVRFLNCKFTDCGRCGFSVTPANGFICSDIIAFGSHFDGDQNAMDAEPDNLTGTVDGLTFLACTLNGTTTDPVSFGFGLFSGNAGDAHNVRIAFCEITGGPVNFSGASDVQVVHNRIYNSSNKPAISVGGGNGRIDIGHNTIYHLIDNRQGSFPATRPNGAIDLHQDTPVTTAYIPQLVDVHDNEIVLYQPNQCGISARALLHFAARRNRITVDPSCGAGTTGAGIYCDGGAGNNSHIDSKTVIIADNTIVNPRGMGINLHHQAGDRVVTHAVLIDRNVIIDDQNVHTLTTGINIDAGYAGVGATVRNNSDNVVVAP